MARLKEERERERDDHAGPEERAGREERAALEARDAAEAVAGGAALRHPRTEADEHAAERDHDRRDRGRAAEEIRERRADVEAREPEATGDQRRADAAEREPGEEHEVRRRGLGRCGLLAARTIDERRDAARDAHHGHRSRREDGLDR